MDQNTNNSLTSAPQGGDFSDIIIPNAYAAKPKGKNIKKYVVFGLIGLVFIFVFGFFFNKIIISSNTISKEELNNIINSDDFNNILYFESLLTEISNNNVSFNVMMGESMYYNLHDGLDSMRNLKTILEYKKNVNGNISAKADYQKFKDELNIRLELYAPSVGVYDDFYNAYHNLDIDLLNKYLSNSNNLNYSSLAKNFRELITHRKKIQEISNAGNCTLDDNENIAHGSDDCLAENEIIKTLKQISYNDQSFKKIFSNIYESNQYINDREIISFYIESCISQLR